MGELMKSLDGMLFARMINSGAANLRAHAKEVNDLNVFPIPDGDTGDNMLMTIMGGVDHGDVGCERLCETADRVSSGMLLSARGNSGVILSQFFEGISGGFSGLHSADASAIGEAFRCGVRQAYSSVVTPTEGTILTVVREATDYACGKRASSPEEFLDHFIDEARRSLARTPELLPVLKKAGVVDSGAAGLIYIVDGMIRAVRGKDVTELSGIQAESATEELDLDAFGEDDVLEFGYCTELLIRLQSTKTDIASFDVRVITDYLKTVGDSIVTVQNGSIVKLHVHTKTPDKVLSFCRQYGEFLKVKIENMSLQHNNTVGAVRESGGAPMSERKPYGVVAVASGDGLKKTFLERGADVIVDGGQSMNPSSADFIAAFDEVNAEVIFVFPNNGNIVLTAEQAAKLYTFSDVRVIQSTTIGAGYASLAMLDTGSCDTAQIEAELNEAMDGVVTAEISHCVRDAWLDGYDMHTGDYIGFADKRLLAVSRDRLEALYGTLDGLGFSDYDICIVIRGKDAPCSEEAEIERHIAEKYRGKEVYFIDGAQDIYDYILVIE